MRIIKTFESYEKNESEKHMSIDDYKVGEKWYSNNDEMSYEVKDKYSPFKNRKYMKVQWEDGTIESYSEDEIKQWSGDKIDQ